jgi:hypothetical protein
MTRVNQCPISLRSEHTLLTEVKNISNTSWREERNMVLHFIHFPLSVVVYETPKPKSGNAPGLSRCATYYNF